MVGYIQAAVAEAIKNWATLKDAKVMPVRAVDGDSVVVNTPLPAIAIHVRGNEGEGGIFIGGDIRQYFTLELWTLIDVPNYTFSSDNNLQANKLDISDDVIRCVEHPDFLQTVKEDHDLNMVFEKMETETTYGTSNAITVTIDVHKVVYECSVKFDLKAEDYNQFAILERIEVDNNGINEIVIENE